MLGYNKHISSKKKKLFCAPIFYFLNYFALRLRALWHNPLTKKEADIGEHGQLVNIALVHHCSNPGFVSL